MQSIVADTTPLNYLALIQAADVLPSLYRRVLIPPAVKVELAHANAPAIVRAWISQPPLYLEVVNLKQPVVRRHRLISISYTTHGRCHSGGREFESRRPRHSLSSTYRKSSIPA
jgi:hypothetical protein